MVLEVVDVSKVFFDIQSNSKIEALKEVRFSVEEGQFACVVGPSGCGKTTLLRIISGLEKSTLGKIFLQGAEIIQVKNDIGMVFQEYALFPWRTVWENIEFGLKIRGISILERRQKVEECLRTVRLEGFEGKYPKEISTGMKQRAAIARTLAVDPKILLMDEPFGSLDDQTRMNLQSHLLSIWSEAKKTILFVTHNIDEAIFLGQTIICLSSRPGTVKKIVKVDLSYPRDRTDEAFNHYRKEIQGFFRIEIGSKDDSKEPKGQG